MVVWICVYQYLPMAKNNSSPSSVPPPERAVVVNPPPLRRAVLVNPSPLQRVMVVNPPPLQRAAVVNPTSLERAVVVNPPVEVAIIRARPTRYVYVPGLARAELTQAPCQDSQSFMIKIRSAFGYRKKTVVNGSVSDSVEDDHFMTGAVTALFESKGAAPLDCGRYLRWIQLSSMGRSTQGKAFELLGTPQQNLLALKAGDKPKAPKALQYGNGVHLQPCLATEYFAQVKGKVLPSNNQVQAEANGAKPLAGLQAEDILYIVGHGNPLGATLTYKVPPPASHPVRDRAIGGGQPGRCANDEHQERWHVDPNTLAALLVDEGLPSSHENIEMVMCYGAGLSLTSEQTVQPFCQRLAGALSGLGYRRIKVRGAYGLVIGPDLAVNPSLRLEGKKLIINPNRQVNPTDQDYEKLFHSFASS